MLHAILHGKVSAKLRDQEDVLTSCVFGLLDTLPATLGLAPWLRQARTLRGTALTVDAEALDNAGPTFWPSYPLVDGRVEPDVLFDLGDSAILIEAKYGAGPSGWPSAEEGPLAGQLGRQWRAASAPGRSLELVYLTAGWTMPSEEMEAMIAEVERMTEDRRFRDHLYWLSWRSLPQALAKEAQTPRRARALTSLRRYIARAGLDTFTGVRPPRPVEPVAWSFQP